MGKLLEYSKRIKRRKVRLLTGTGGGKEEEENNRDRWGWKRLSKAAVRDWKALEGYANGNAGKRDWKRVK